MTLAERIERTPLAWPMALLMAGAVAFLMFAMPTAIVAQLLAGAGAGALANVGADGIGGRAVLAVLFAGAAGGAVWLLFHMLDGPHLAYTALDDGQDADDVDLFAPVVAAERPAPQLRRADAHPDAPARRPIFAASDLGAPLHPVPEGDTRLSHGEPPTIHRAPIFLDHAPVAQSRPEPATEPTQAPQAPSAGADILLLDPFLMAAPAEPSSEGRFAALDPLPRPAMQPRNGDESVAELMARLEQGLATRDGAAVSPPGSGGDLRRALDDLRRIARG